MFLAPEGPPGERQPAFREPSAKSPAPAKPQRATRDGHDTRPSLPSVRSGGAQCSSALDFDTLYRALASNQPIERPGPRASENKSDRRCEQRERKLDAAGIEEPLLDMNEKNCDDHCRCQAERSESREKSGDESNAAEEFDECDKRSED